MAAEPSEDLQRSDLSEESELLARHRKEVKDLRAKIQALKKSIPKGDKKKKKEVGAEIAQLELELEERHKKELEEQNLDQLNGEGGGGNDVAIQQRMEGLSLTGCAADEKEGNGEREGEKESAAKVAGGAGKRSRAQKRKDKKAQKEQERDKRIAEGEAETAMDNPRLREREKLTSLLTPQGLAIQDITPDGHCLYAAIADQLKLRLGIKSSVPELRSQCAEYIHSHSDDFLPYLTDPDTGDQFTPSQLDQYCTDIAETATWGGQLEIRALSHVYKIPVKVYQAAAAMVTVGEEYPNDGRALTLAYHLYEYGLGEHYNSIVPR